MATNRPTPAPSGRGVPGSPESRPPSRRLSEKRNERYVDEQPLRRKVAAAAVNLGGTLSPRLRQPTVLSGILAVVLAIVVLGQGTFAQLLGTAGHDVHQVVASQTVTPTSPPAAAVIKQTGFGPKHMAIDPFRPLVGTNGQILAPISLHQEALQNESGAGSGTGPGQHTLPPKRGPTSCSATVVVVRSGQSLWSISADHLATTGYHTITTAWHALYAANHSTIGADPDLIVPGQHLCLPMST